MEGGPRRNSSSDMMNAAQVYIPTIIKCTTATFLAAFMWRIPLNSTVLATTTHRKPKRMSDETDTHVRT